MPSEIVVPELGESVVEATVGRWLKKEGEHVSVGEAVVELETDKVDLEVGAEQDGVLSEIAVQEGEDVEVGSVLGKIEDVPEGEEPSEDGGPPKKAERAEADEEGAEGEEEGKEPAEAQPKPSEKELATPVAKRVAEDLGVQIGEIDGSGAGGRVTKDDVQKYAESKDKEGRAEEGEVEPEQRGDGRQQFPDELTKMFASDGEREERVKMSRRRRTIARRLVEAQGTAAMLTTFNDLDMSAVMELRARKKESFQERYGVKLGLSSFFVKASVGALKAFPRLNAEIDGDHYILKRHYDIGVAIGAEEGLVVPVIREADRKSFAEIEREVRELAKKADEGGLTLKDLQGGTFTITNGGVFGSLLSTPILNPPQVGILGLHRIEERPVAIDGEIVLRPMMYVAVTYDHRIVDGREAVQFLVKLKALIEDPEALLLEG